LGGEILDLLKEVTAWGMRAASNNGFQYPDRPSGISRTGPQDHQHQSDIAQLADQLLERSFT
jgi:hypothetical protein